MVSAVCVCVYMCMTLCGIHYSLSIIAKSRVSSIVSEVFEGILESRVKCLTCKKISVTREPFQDLSLPIPGD